MKYVLDTNVLVSNPYSIYSFVEPGTEILITSATMGELDHLKEKEKTSRDARLAIRVLSKVIIGHDYDEISKTGISLSKTNPAVPESVTLRMVDYTGDEQFSLDQQDAKIIATCKQENAVLITRDLNMLLIALSGGCEAIQYTGDDTLKDSDILYPGYINIDKFWEIVNVTGYNDDIALVSYDFDGIDLINVDELYPNQFIIDDGKLVGRIVNVGEYCLEVCPIKPDSAIKRKLLKTLQPRDALQAAFVHSSLEDDVDVITLMGSAGSGKTILAVATAMHQVLAGHYANMMYVKADSPLAGEIGFLPGTLGEKLRPAIEPCITSLNIIFKDKNDVEKYIQEELLETNMVQFPSLHYFRGRSIGHPDAGKGSVLIVDECQNLSNHEIKSVISRCGENTLLILCGNIKQIDNPRNTAINNGFVYAVEKLKSYEHSSHIILDTVYRGRLAAFVEDNF